MVQYNTEIDHLILVNLSFFFLDIFLSFLKNYTQNKILTKIVNVYIIHNKHINTNRRLSLLEKYLRTEDLF